MQLIEIGLICILQDLRPNQKVSDYQEGSLDEGVENEAKLSNQ